ncbi:MAG: tetratricopeptide repeat protein [Planctomycetaceae bacterium]
MGLFSRDLSDDETTRRMASIEGTRGPLERLLHRRSAEESADDHSLSSAEGQAELERAEQLSAAGKHKQAEKAYKSIAKHYKESPVAEDALFLRAESMYKRQRYSWAQDGYDELLKQFPSTRYLDRVTRRMFTIAQVWLQSPEVVSTDEIQQVNFEDPSKTPPPAEKNPKPQGITRRVPIFPNFVDRSRPVFDTEGRALEALRSIWTKDPTGSLADDALMLEASYHLRKGNYIEADRLYEVLRKDYPKSAHFENAYVLGSHVKLMGYQGAAYDSRSLEDSEQLKITSAQLFPNHPAHDRLQDELRKIELAKVEAIWNDLCYYQRKRKPAAVAIYCRQILAEYPNSDYAARARKVLNELEANGSIAGSAKANATRPDAHENEPPARVRLTEPKTLPENSRNKDEAPGWVDLGV